MTDKADKTCLQGSITALVTPFRAGRVDEQTFARLIERQIAAGTNGLVPAGTTGESPALSVEEHKRLISQCVEVTQGRVPVIAGTGSNNTAQSLALSRHAQKAGADALLVVTGYYNKPSQAGIIAHFEALNAAVNLPIIVYNVPGRTCCDVAVETLGTLSKLENIIAVKDATGDLARVARQRLVCGTDFVQLSGEDITAVGFNVMGGIGCISVTSNIVPALCAQLQKACADGDWQGALDLQDRLTPLHDALFSDTSPGPVKYALSRLDLCTLDLRLPLVEPSEKAKAQIDAAIAGLGLL